MSNLVCIAICILISFVTSALFMSAYKEDISDELHTLRSRLNEAWEAIHVLRNDFYVLNAKYYDLKNKLKEIESKNDA